MNSMLRTLRLTASKATTVRACLILRVVALSRRVLARPRRANKGVYGVEQARSACSTPYTPSGERRANNLLSFVENARSAFSTKLNKLGERHRREQASVMASRQTLKRT